jgi:O-acetyl-ADP-ribose deacetylase (regulator of RNase III)
MSAMRLTTGIYGYPMNEAIDIFVKTANDFRVSKVLEEIRFVFFVAEDAEMMQQAIV